MRCIQFTECRYIRPLPMIRAQILASDLHRAHLGSPEVTNMFLLITHDWKSWGRECSLIVFVRLVTTHWLICNMTCVSHHVALSWCWQMLTWQMLLTSRSSCTMRMFRGALTRGTRWCPNYVTTVGLLSTSKTPLGRWTSGSECWLPS